MKRTVAAVLFTVFAAPAVAVDLPLEQNQLDRALPNIEQNNLN